MDDCTNAAALRNLLHRAKTLAVKYYELTGKPLGVTGEVAELEAAEHLNLLLTAARTPYYDAERRAGELLERFQIKGRAVPRSNLYRGRTPAIKCDAEYEYILLVLLDKATYEVIEIWQADRIQVADRLAAPGSGLGTSGNLSQLASLNPSPDVFGPTHLLAHRRGRPKPRPYCYNTDSRARDRLRYRTIDY